MKEILINNEVHIESSIPQELQSLRQSIDKELGNPTLQTLCLSLNARLAKETDQGKKIALIKEELLGRCENQSNNTFCNDINKERDADLSDPDILGDIFHKHGINFDISKKEPFALLQQKNNHEQNNEILLTIKFITLVEAIDIGRKPALTNKEKDIIYIIKGSKIPTFNYGLAKQYIIVQGATNPSESSLIHTGYNNADFAYSIAKNGAIFQYFDPSLGSGGVTGKACLHGDPTVNATSIDIEFSAKTNPNGIDTEEPNQIQCDSGKKLIKHLQKQFEIPSSNISTSARVVEYTNGKLLSGSHTDTWTRDPSLLQELGINTHAQRGEPNTEDIQLRIQVLQQQKGKHPKIHTPGLSAAIRFREGELSKKEH